MSDIGSSENIFKSELMKREKIQTIKIAIPHFCKNNQSNGIVGHFNNFSKSWNETIEITVFPEGE